VDTILTNLTHLNLQTVRSPNKTTQMNSVRKQHIALEIQRSTVQDSAIQRSRLTQNGNPNLGGEDASVPIRPNRLSTPIASPNIMSEGSSGKLQQKKDFTPEVDELLPQATALAQVGPPALLQRALVLARDVSRLGTSRRHWTSSSPSRSKQEM
jgi:hypothetical protein